MRGDNSIFQVTGMRKEQINGRQSKKTKVGGGAIRQEPGPAWKSEWRLVVQDQVCEQSEPTTNLCHWGQPGSLRGPLRLNTHLPTKPGGPQGDGPCTLHVCVPWIAE